MGEEWKSPIEYPMLFSVILLLLLGTAGFYYIWNRPRWDLIIVPLGICTMIVLGFFLLLRHMHADIWSSQGLVSSLKSTALLLPLTNALKDAGFEPTLRKGRGKVPFPDHTIIDLKRDLTVIVVSRGEASMLFVGPRRRGTREEIEHIKDVINKTISDLGK